MKVLHITRNDNDGAGLCCLRIHETLLYMGIESKVVTLHNFQSAEHEYRYGTFYNKLSKVISKFLNMIGLPLTDYCKVVKLSYQYRTTYSLPVSYVNLLNCKWVKWADIIHLHWVEDYLDYPTFFRNVRKPIIWTLHDENFFYGIAHYSSFVLPNNPIEQKYSKIKKVSLSFVDKMGVVLLSESSLIKYKTHELLQGRIVRVINNSVDTNRFKPIPFNEARKKLGLSEDLILFAFMANSITEERKGLNILSKVIAEMGNAKVKILAIGNNPGNDKWQNVISLGMKTTSAAISEVLSAANYFAMPSKQEAFAQSPMEAMSCGLPVVAFPVSGTSELVNIKNGVVCDDFTSEALTRGIETLLSRHYDNNEIRQDMINRFSPEKIARQYIDLYMSILN